MATEVLTAGLIVGLKVVVSIATEAFVAIAGFIIAEALTDDAGFTVDAASEIIAVFAAIDAEIEDIAAGGSLS